MNYLKNVWAKKENTTEYEKENDTKKNENDSPGTVHRKEEDFVEDKEQTVEEYIMEMQKEKKKRTKLSKLDVRGHALLSISVNIKEEMIFKHMAQESGMSLSAWVRQALYKQAKIKTKRK